LNITFKNTLQSKTLQKYKTIGGVGTTSHFRKIDALFTGVSLFAARNFNKKQPLF